MLMLNQITNKTNIMNLFRHRIGFSTPDPLGNGLAEEIAAEQREPEAFTSLEDTSGEELTAQWNAIVKDIEKDPDWFKFND